jgi:hypothetical protein
MANSGRGNLQAAMATCGAAMPREVAVRSFPEDVDDRVRGPDLAANEYAAAGLSVRWGRLIWAGVAQDPKAPLLVGHVDITARIDEHVFRLGDQVSR